MRHTAKEASSMAAVAQKDFPVAKLFVAEGSRRKCYLTLYAFLMSPDG